MRASIRGGSPHRFCPEIKEQFTAQQRLDIEVRYLARGKTRCVGVGDTPQPGGRQEADLVGPHVLDELLRVRSYEHLRIKLLRQEVQQRPLQVHVQVSVRFVQ